MIHLKDEAKIVGNSYPIKGIREVKYKRRAEIVPLLTGSARVSNLNPQAAPFVPRNMNEDQDDGDDEDEQPVEEPEGEERVDNAVNVDEVALAVDAGRTQGPTVLVTKEEIQVAKALLKGYRKAKSRQQSAGSALAEGRIKLFTKCLEIVSKAEMRTKYRVLFLGPLPHILVCLEKVKQSAQSAKKRASKRLKTAEHAQLEEAMKQVDTAKYVCVHIASEIMYSVRFAGR